MAEMARRAPEAVNAALDEKGGAGMAMAGRRRRRWVVLGSACPLLAAVVVLAMDHLGQRAAARPGSPTGASSGAEAAPAPSDALPGVACTVSVTRYGASTESAAFDAALRAGAGGTVGVPAGEWRVTSEIVIPASETVTGAGAGRTTLLQTVADHNLLQARASHTVVEDLTLDTQTDNGGIAFATGASDVTLRNAVVRSGRQPGHFAIYFAGPRGATPTRPRYSHGNVLAHVVVNDEICDDGVSWSFQAESRIDDVSETGSRLALYVDDATTVDGYHYTPGPCAAADSGYWITPPSEDITIEGFVSNGAAGKICPNIAQRRRCSEDVPTPVGFR